MTFRPLLLALLLGSACPALAADPVPIDKRVDKVERELRAVQRKVFPNGTPAFTEPEIAAPSAATAAGDPAATPLAEMSSRVSGLERELARLTGQIEQNEHRLTLMSQTAAQDRAEFDARLKALESAGAPPAVAVAPPADTPFRTPPTAARPGTRTPPRAAAAPVEPAPEPAAAPIASADPAEDAYMAGYRLWADKKFGDAALALGEAAAKYPKSRRASYARNLQGRAFLDNGQPAEAARILYGNYQKDPRGERAPESLFYLGSALVQLKKNEDACRAYGELNAVYGETMADALRTRLPAARKAAKCEEAVATADEAPKPAPTAKKPVATTAKKGK